MRTNIIFAAWNCDYSRLEEYTGLRHGEPFVHSFAAGAKPAEYWQTLEETPQEQGGEPVLERLVDVLSLPPARQGIAPGPDGHSVDGYIWPAAAADGEVTDEEWEQLEAIYPPEQVREWRRGGQYLGYRVAITADGDWLFFVAGD